MKLKNKILAIGTTLAIVSPIAAVISCGTDAQKTNGTNQGVQTGSMTDAINGAESMYVNDYNYADLLKNNKSAYDATNGVLTVDMAALRQMADSYPINSNKFNSEIWGKLTTESIKQQLIKSGDSGDKLAKEMKNVSSTSSPLTVQTDSIYYPYFTTATPKADGTKGDDITPGFYHIRPEDSSDVLTSDPVTSWNRISVNNTDSFIDKISNVIDKTENGMLTEGDKIIVNINTSNQARNTGLTSRTYTYYEHLDDGTDLDKEGFYLTKPTQKDGSGVWKKTDWLGSVTNYTVTAAQNIFDTTKIKLVSGKTDTYELTTYNMDDKTKGLTATKGYLFTSTDAPTNEKFSYAFENDSKWDPASPFIFRHFLDDTQSTKVFSKDDENSINDFFTVSPDKSEFQFLQPDSRWISPKAGFFSFGTVDTDKSILSFNDQEYSLTRAALKGDSILNDGYFYNPEKVSFFNTDALNWKNDHGASVSVPNGIQRLLLSKTENHLDGFDGLLKGYYHGDHKNAFTLYTRFDDADKSEMPDELQGFYLTRPKTKDEAQSAMFNLGTGSNDIDESSLKAFSYIPDNINKPIKVKNNGKMVDAKYWNPANFSSMRIEMLYDAASKFTTKAGFDVTGMIIREADYSSGSSIIITQQDRGFAPKTNAGSWESSMVSSSSGSEDGLYTYADFIEVKGSSDFYYQHEYFNYDGSKKLNLRTMSQTDREQYRLPEILRGFYKNNTKLDYDEYNKGKDSYIEDSLSTNSIVPGDDTKQHDKLIFNGLNGSKSITSYKGVVYKNKSINGMTAHTSWSPNGGSSVVLNEKQAEKWYRDGSDNELIKPDDYFSLDEMHFGADITSGINTIKGFAEQVMNVPFEGLKTINFVWGTTPLATINDISKADFNRMLQILKSKKIFTGNIKTVIANLALSTKSQVNYGASKNIADVLFGKDEEAHKTSLMGQLATQLEKYTKLKGEQDV